MLHFRYVDITGQTINECSFKVLKDDEVHGWLGASPDGLVQPLGLLPPLVYDVMSAHLCTIQAYESLTYAQKMRLLSTMSCQHIFAPSELRSTRRTQTL